MRLHKARLGFTLTEMLIAMAVMGIIGLALSKMMTTQGRFMRDTANRRSATSVARSAMNVLLADLRMVQDSGGVDSASSDGKALRVRVPYRFGLICGSNGSATTASMLPIDSGTVGMSTYAGYAYRVAASKRYVIVTPAAPTGTDIFVNSASSSMCTGSAVNQARISTLTINGRTGGIVDLRPPSPSAAVGAAVYFWQRVTYSFAPSTAFPGRYGLWRSVQGGTTEELMGPFEAGARFRFWTDTVTPDTSRTTVPDVNSIRGVDLVLSAISPKTAAGSTNRTSQLVTSIFFKNRRAP
jgi:prepilin-type N-terminal cleavage/methylation domain-containing protein